MCYVLILSTSSGEDLARNNSELVTFSRDVPDVAGREELRFEHQWYIGSRTGCSCSFRHLYSVELGFGRPVDWYPEEAKDLDATLELIRLIRKLVNDGDAVDCMDAWELPEKNGMTFESVDVDLSSLSDEEFRFFENHRFNFISHARESGAAIGQSS